MFNPLFNNVLFNEALFAGQEVVAFVRSVSVDCRTDDGVWSDSRQIDAAWNDLREINVPWSDSRAFLSGDCTVVAKLDVRVERFVVGDDLDLDRTYGNVPQGDSVIKAWLTIKRKESDLDVDAIVQLSITSGGTSQGQILNAGGSSPYQTVMRFSLSAAQTLLLTPGRAYFYDIQLKTANGKINTREKGTITLEKQITIASS